MSGTVRGEGESESARAILEAVAAVAEDLLREPFSPAVAHRVLARLGAAAGASRSYLFRHRQLDSGEVVADQLAEWVAADVEPQIDNPELQGFSYNDTGNEWLLDRLTNDEVVAARAEEIPDSFQPILESEGILSILLTPIRAAGVLWGLVGFDECVRARQWTEAEIGALRVAASLLGATVERAASESDRQASRERLRQAERMEALGWLAGGLARDFDGLMTTVRGYGDRVLAHLHPGDPLRADVSEILLAAERAAELTRDLASLGRRQPQRPEPLDLSDWLSERLPLLRRLVGGEISIVAPASPRGVVIEADPALLQQAVVTFVLEARERLADGGRIELGCDVLQIEALEQRGVREALGARSARLVVHDDGPALDEEIVQRLFEPFGDGRQTARGGLAMAAAYGIVRQCGGIVLLASSQAEGTTCELLFPLAAEMEAPERSTSREEEPESDRPATVLLVEDEDLIRDLAEQILVAAGYRVVTAANASEAMALAEEPTFAVDLLLTDVVMPGASGADLAHRLLRRHPEMRILYMSGYSDSLVFRYGVLQERAAFLRKPFSAEVLERRVAELLASPPFA